MARRNGVISTVGLCVSHDSLFVEFVDTFVSTKPTSSRLFLSEVPRLGVFRSEMSSLMRQPVFLRPNMTNAVHSEFAKRVALRERESKKG
jgi:hypothetical protein